MKHTPSLDSIKARLRARIPHLKRRQTPEWIPGFGRLTEGEFDTGLVLTVAEGVRCPEGVTD